MLNVAVVIWLLSSVVDGMQDHDLVVISGNHLDIEYHDQEVIALLVEQGDNDLALISYPVLFYDEKTDVCDVTYKCASIPVEMVRAFKPMSLSKSSNQSGLSVLDRSMVRATLQIHAAIVEQRHLPNSTFWLLMKAVPLKTFCNVFYAFIWKKFGLSALYYVHHLDFKVRGTHDDFNCFYQKFLRLRPRLLSNAGIADSIQKGDLVKLKRTLKQQKNESLQARAAHFCGSFGQIMTMRKNSRNQTEYEIQSLFDKDMKLALRPKYLFKITKIYLHCRQNQAFQRSMEKNTDDHVLCLPYFWSENQNQAIFGMNKFQSFVFAMSHRKDNIIIDPVISISYLLLCWNADGPKSGCMSTENTFRGLAFCMDKINWSRIMNVIGKMKKTSKQKEKIFMEGIEKLFKSHFDKMIKSQYEEEILIPGTILKPSGKTYDFYMELEAKVHKDLRKAHMKNQALYNKLLTAIAEDAHVWIAQQHPEYWQEFETERAHLHNTFKEALEALYRISVIRHYFAANAKGKNLHVMCYPETNREDTLLQNLTVALSAKINTEWKNNNTKVSDMIVSELIVTNGRLI